MWILLSLLTILVAAGTWVGVAVVRGYALRRLVDLPNERSSHSRPTPRGGGLALTVMHLLGILAATLLGVVPVGLAVALLGGGSLVAFIGFLDDHRHVPALVRLLCHFVAFGWAIWWIGAQGPLDLGRSPAALGLAATLLLLVGLAWFLNLFNFMDGIDGIAGAQAIFMSGMATLLLMVRDAGPDAITPTMLLAAATAAFLTWNWPPARIFLGDVGSGYLGYALGVLALWTTAEGWLTPWTWLILGGAFLADATVTLLVRVRARAVLAEAHRSHAYQRLSRYWRGHRPVTLLFAAVNLFWLAPWAGAATLWPEHGAVFALVALLPLFWGALRLGAGRAGELEAGK
jgi:Fuc2NAc and GlcNAc transferase